MTTFILEYSDGPRASRRAGSYPEYFRRLAEGVLDAGIKVTRRLCVGTVSTPYRFLEIIDGDATEIRRYGDLVREVFGGPMRVRPAYPIADEAPRAKEERAAADRVERAGRESFPASDAPPWNLGRTANGAVTHGTASARHDTDLPLDAKH